MILILLILLVLISSIVDWYMIGSFTEPRSKVRKVSIYLAAIYNPLILAILLFHTSLLSGAVGHKITISAMWVLYVFMLSLLPRFSFMAVSVWGFLFRGRALMVRKVIFVVASVVAWALFVVMIWSGTYGRTLIRVENVEIASPQIPAAFDGYRIAQFSDLHLGNLPSSNSIVEGVVNTINGLNVDMVVNTGDLVNISSAELNDRWMDVLSKFRATDGVYSVLGNHDYGWYIYDTTYMNAATSTARLAEKQRGMGWRLLRNENVRVARGGDTIALAGVGFPQVLYSGRSFDRITSSGSNLGKAMSGVPDSMFSVLLSHSPQLFDSMPSVAKADLTLSGHVHAMQAKLKIGKWQVSPAQLLYPMFSGLYEDRGRYLYINDGIGYVLYPMRIGTRPEITVFTLRRTNKR